jgi:hypothetical protein
MSGDDKHPSLLCFDCSIYLLCQETLASPHCYSYTWEDPGDSSYTPPNHNKYPRLPTHEP